MDPTDRLLDRLRGVRSTGRDSFVALCPAHEDRRPSLSVRRGDDGRVLLKCFSGGCSAADVVESVGLELRDLFPPRLDAPSFAPGHRRRVAPKIPARDVLQVLDREALVIGIVAMKVRQNRATERDYQQLEEAISTIADVRSEWMEVNR